jgi:3-oxoacyl-[acyl-carrier-protein] synthase II
MRDGLLFSNEEMSCQIPASKSMSEPAARVAITGYGCVTALGMDASSSWDALLQRKSARGPVTEISVEGCRVTEGAQARLPDLPGYSQKQISKLSRASRLLIPAAREALGQAGLLETNGMCALARMESSISTTASGMEMGEGFLQSVWNNQPRGQASLLARYQAQQQIGDLHRILGFSGPCTLIANACASGSNSIGHAADLIRCGMADVILAGGYDALCELVFCGFDSLLTLAPEACRPFDRGRNGLMLGEGAAFLILEKEARAQARGAGIYGFVAGYGHTTDTGHLTLPNQKGLPIEVAVRQALKAADIEPDEIGYINAHGTATPYNDTAEARAYSRIFSNSPARLSSTKAAIGHTLGAAGSIEAVLSLLALQNGELPPQINVRDPEPDVADRLVKIGEKSKLDYALNVNLGFGGSTAALVLSRS